MLTTLMEIAGVLSFIIFSATGAILVLSLLSLLVEKIWELIKKKS